MRPGSPPSAGATFIKEAAVLGGIAATSSYRPSGDGDGFGSH